MPFKKLDDIEAKEIIPGYNGKFIHTENMSIVYWDIKADYSMPEHSHPHEQVANMIEGKFELTIEGQKQIVEAGTVAVIPSNAKHSGKAITDCRIIDVFYPTREDYR